VYVDVLAFSTSCRVEHPGTSQAQHRDRQTEVLVLSVQHSTVPRCWQIELVEGTGAHREGPLLTCAILSASIVGMPHVGLVELPGGQGSSPRQRLQ